MINTEPVIKLRLMAQAYKQLLQGSEGLLELDRLYWTEKLLLMLVRSLYKRRLEQLGEVLRDGE